MQFMPMNKNFYSWHGAQAAWHHGKSRLLNALFPFLVLFGAHILSFYEWKVVCQWLCDNSGVTCVYWQINIKHLREKIQFLCFQFRKVAQKH